MQEIKADATKTTFSNAQTETQTEIIIFALVLIFDIKLVAAVTSYY